MAKAAASSYEGQHVSHDAPFAIFTEKYMGSQESRAIQYGIEMNCIFRYIIANIARINQIRYNNCMGSLKETFAEATALVYAIGAAPVGGVILESGVSMLMAAAGIGGTVTGVVPTAAFVAGTAATAVATYKGCKALHQWANTP